MEDFRWHFGNFTTRMIDIAYKRFVDTDREYKETEYYLNKHGDRFDEILNSLSDEDRKFAKEYISKSSYKEACFNESLYITGYRDCVKLLKEIGII